MIRPAHFAVLLSCLLASACLTPSNVDKMGDSEAEKVEKEMGLVRDAKVAGYVNAIGERMVPHSTRPEGPWTFRIVDTPEPNAFALPGGHVWVSRGLLALVNSEDELAGVVGHEMGHVTNSHASKRIGAAILTAPISIVTGLAGFAAGLVSPKVGAVLVDSGQLITQGAVLAPYSRAQENDADRVGQDLAARAGYAPEGLTAFLHTLDREQKLTTDERRPSFLDSHPPSADRVERTRQHALSLQRADGTPIAATRAELLSRLEGLLVGPDPSQGVIEERRFLHPVLDLTLEFPEDWNIVNTAQAVAALSPGKDALISLQLMDVDRTLDSVLQEIEAEGSKLQFERFSLGSLEAARTQAAGRGRVAELVLIGHGGNVYALVGQAPSDSASTLEPAWNATVESFRPMSQEEHRSIREQRLRVRPARAGETPAAIGERLGSTWEAGQIAVANGVEPSHAFAAGDLVKVALPQRYVPPER